MRKGGMEGEEGRREGGRVGGTKGGKEGRREGTRAKPGNQLLYLYPLVSTTLDYASAGCDLYTTT